MGTMGDLPLLSIPLPSTTHLDIPRELNHCSTHPGYQRTGDTNGHLHGKHPLTVPGWEHIQLEHGTTRSHHSRCCSPVRNGSTVALGFFLQT